MKKTLLAVMLLSFVVMSFTAAHAQMTTAIMAPEVPFYGTDTARTYEGFVVRGYWDPQWNHLLVVDTKDKGKQFFTITNRTQFHPSSIKVRDGVYVIVKSDEFNHTKYVEVLPFVEWQNRTGWKVK